MSYRCPTCERRDLDTIATLPYVRGFILAYQIGTKKFVGCRSCVRKSIFKEVGLSPLIGWFSITALIINPFLLVYGVFRGITVSPDQTAVRKSLTDAGLPAENTEVDILQVTYGLAAAMIAADGKIKASEVEAATRIGDTLFDGFDASELARQLQRHKELPDPADLAAVLEEPGKLAIYRYLEAIAGADGEVSADEATMLLQIRTKLGIALENAAAA